MTVIAIDGPAGAGKSTVARALAYTLGFTYLNSGAMYRSAALAAAERGVEPARAAAEARIEFPGVGATPGEDATPGADAARVLLDGRDVTREIRTPEISEAASRVAADPAVRRALVVRQRQLLASGDWVAEGRDIGEVVAPDAELKVFLTADPRERARRRAAELDAALESVLAEQAIRDQRDRDREHSPLRPAPGAVILDTSGLTVPEVVERIIELVRGATCERPQG